jgi:hypothetical protein
VKRIYGVVTGLVLACGSAGDADAQTNVARFETSRSRVYTQVGLDPALMTSIGYGRVLRVIGHDFQLAGEAAVVASGRDISDARARITTTTSLLRWGSVHLTGSASAVARHTDNAIYRAVSIGADATASLGFYRPGWFVAGEFGKDKSIVTHVKHTDLYRETFYENAKDGWYLDAGGYYRYGFAGGFAIGPVEIAGRAGWQKTEDWNEMTTPNYVSLGVGIGF